MGGMNTNYDDGEYYHYPEDTIKDLVYGAYYEAHWKFFGKKIGDGEIAQTLEDMIGEEGKEWLFKVTGKTTLLDVIKWVYEG